MTALLGLCLVIAVGSLAAANPDDLNEFDPYLGDWVSTNGLLRLSLTREENWVTGRIYADNNGEWEQVFNGTFGSNAECPPATCPVFGFSIEPTVDLEHQWVPSMLVAPDSPPFQAAGATPGGLHFYNVRYLSDGSQVETFEQWTEPQGGSFTYQLWGFSKAGEPEGLLTGKWIQNSTGFDE